MWKVPSMVPISVCTEPVSPLSGFLVKSAFLIYFAVCLTPNCLASKGEWSGGKELCSTWCTPDITPGVFSPSHFCHEGAGCLGYTCTGSEDPVESELSLSWARSFSYLCHPSLWKEVILPLWAPKPVLTD